MSIINNNNIIDQLISVNMQYNTNKYMYTLQCVIACTGTPTTTCTCVYMKSCTCIRVSGITTNPIQVFYNN